MQIFVEQHPELAVITIDLEGAVLTPKDLVDIHYPSVNPRLGVIINGRAPIWLYATFLHQYHYCAFTGINDPRLGAVITATHHPDYAVGDVLSISVNT